MVKLLRRIINLFKKCKMAKINNTATYATATPTNNTLLLGSESSGGATKNYKVSELSSFLNLNPTLSTLAVTGNASIGGTLTLGSTSISTSGITTGTILSTGTVAASFLATDPSGAPVSSSAAGILGSIVADANYIYVCTATDTWKRVAISTW
jgi:hypothetical protein